MTSNQWNDPEVVEWLESEEGREWFFERSITHSDGEQTNTSALFSWFQLKDDTTKIVFQTWEFWEVEDVAA